MDKLKGPLLAAIAVIGAGSVGLQFFLNVTRHNLDHSLAWRLVDFFSFFTITTNIAAVAVAALALARPGSRFSRPGWFTAVAVDLLVVAVTYQWLLRGDPRGLAWAANAGLHQIVPGLFILFWLGFTPKAELTFKEPPAWLAYPLAFIAWTLARGALIHRYPYFFADVDKLGYPRALLNGLMFMAVFYPLGLAAVALGRMGRRSTAVSSEA